MIIIIIIISHCISCIPFKKVHNDEPKVSPATLRVEAE